MEAPNAAQIAFWNGPGAQRWVTHQRELDHSLEHATEVLFAGAAPAPGERVLDIGCGCGTTTLEFARRTGCAVGIDISAPMLAVARARAQTGATFVEADASTYEFSERFQLACSRFGVMFFADPVAAFANIRRALVPGGRLAFVCFRPLAENPWANLPLDVARGLVQLPASDPHAPGPFAFADGERVRGILERAGFSGIEVERHDRSMHMGADLSTAVARAVELGPLSRIIGDADDATRAALRERLAAALAPHVQPSGVELGMSIWLVRAHA